MIFLVAGRAERNQILAGIVAHSAAKAKMVNLEMLRSAAILTPPAITLEYFRAKSAISCTVEPQSPYLQ